MAAFLSLATYNIIIFSRLLRIICASNAIFLSHCCSSNVWRTTNTCSRRVVVL